MQSVEFLFRSDQTCFVGVGKGLLGFVPRAGQTDAEFEQHVRQVCERHTDAQKALVELRKFGVIALREGEETEEADASPEETVEIEDSPFDRTGKLYDEFLSDKSPDFLAGLRIGYDLGFYDCATGDSTPEGEDRQVLIDDEEAEDA